MSRCGFIRALQDGDSFVVRLVLWFLFIFVSIPLFAMLTVIIAVATAPDAQAATPAEVTVIGTPSSRKIDCAQKREFAELIIGYRERQMSMRDVQMSAIAEAFNHGYSAAQACGLARSIEDVWRIRGNAAGVGGVVYDVCMRERI